MPRARVRAGSRRVATRPLSDRRIDARRSLTAAGIVPMFDLAHGSDPAMLRFLQEVEEAGYDLIDAAGWPCDASALSDDGAIFRDGDRVVYRLGDGTLALAELSWGSLYLKVAGAGRKGVGAAMSAFRTGYPATYLTESEDHRIPVTFWALGPMGPVQRLRMIDASPWDDIARNYTAGVRDQLDGLMRDFDPGAGGQFLLWQGEPGTGKTWALRALVSEWGSWAEAHYITDPDAFFVDSAVYMVDVLLADTYAALTVDGDLVSEEALDQKWRLLILEDTGELLSAKAKERYGQGLSRLLNVVDGMIGQGLRVLVLVTTNDELGELNPAVMRPGRCASQVEFLPLTAAEIREWAADIGEVPEEGETLAELYARVGTGRVALATAGDEEATLAEIARAAEEHAPEGGYGDTYWRSSDRTVFWNAADWSTLDEISAAGDAFLAIDGVDNFDSEAEAAPPDGFVQVWGEGDAVTAAAELDDALLAETLALARTPLELADPALPPAPSADPDPVTAAALAAIGVAHAQTVAQIGDVVSRRREADHSHELAASAVSGLMAAAAREIPAPHVEVHVAAAPAPNVEVHHHAAAQPEQAAPVVNIEAPPAPVVHFTMPEQPAPEVKVIVAAADPAPPAPVHVTVQAPEPAPPRSVRVEFDDDGTKRYVQE